MKHYILKTLVSYIETFATINHIKRVNNNTIKMEFNDKKKLYFDMVKGGAIVYIKDTKDISKKKFNAPFDVSLQKRFNNSKIEKVFLRNDDKIINIIVKSKSSYKEQTTLLQLEFTGKNTNIIILDEKDIVLDALRHIDEWTSVRVVKVGQKLAELEKPNFEYEQKTIENIETYLKDIYLNITKKELENIKKQKINQLKKQIIKIEKILNKLDDVEKLKQKSIDLNLQATKIVSKLYEYTGYEKSFKVLESNNLFRDAKKAKAKAKNQYIEKLNLSQKKAFHTRLINTINECNSIDEVEFYFPKKDKNQKKTKKENPYQSFFIDGYKIMLGRDERENIFLLENSKASDFWFHLQGQVSSHVIVSNTKKTIPNHIIHEAAKICVKFSLDAKGAFSVDFTQRRNVNIQTRANVLYNPYSTTVVKV